jgi:3',5'-cyclic AMP phosphodiesterase CpdA
LTSFLHLSDLHIPDQPGDLWDQVDCCQKLDALIELATTLDFQPSFTIITGDISHTGTKRSYQLAKRYIRKIQNLGGPVFPVMGNRDNRINFRQILLENASAQDAAHCYYSQTIAGIHVIGLDSHSPESTVGSFSDEQLQWLHTELLTHQQDTIIIGLHHPLFFLGQHGLFNETHTSRFQALVSRAHVLAVFNGHLHYPLHTVMDGIYYIQAGSPTFEIAITPKGRSVYDSSSFNFVHYTDRRLFVRPISFSLGTQLIEYTHNEQHRSV